MVALKRGLRPFASVADLGRIGGIRPPEATRRVFLASVATAMSIGFGPTRASPTLSRVNLADFGLVEHGPGATDAEPAFRGALARLPAAGGTLTVPPGRWSFARSEGIAVEVNGRANIAIEGPGATLVCRGTTRPFVFRNCTAPALRGLTVDWDRPPFSQGEVVSVSPDLRSVDVRVDAAFPVDGSEKVPALQTMEPGTRLTARHGIDAYDAVSGVQLVADQILRLTLSRPLRLRPGDTVVLRHKVYEGHVIAFSRCTDLTVEDVTLHCGAGMGVIVPASERATIRRLIISPPPKSGRIMSLTADGIHFLGCRGAITIEDCLIEATGDDCVNVHANFYAVTRVIDSRTLRVNFPAGSVFSASSAAPLYDRFEIVGPRYESLAEAVVVREESGTGGITLQFSRDLPADIGPGDLVLDMETQTTTHVVNCRFPGNRARGILAHMNTVIERCSFAGQSGPALLLSVAPPFPEGPLIKNVLLRDNDITDSCRVFGAGAVTVEAKLAQRATDPLILNSNVQIVGNRFSNLTIPIVAASSITGLLIEQNQVTMPSTPAITLAYVGDVRINDNAVSPRGELIVARSP